MAPVGIRCPEHSGRPQGVQRVTTGVRRASVEGVGARVTRTLIGINVAVYVAELATGGGVNGVGSTIYEKGVLIASAFDSSGHLVGVAQGDWWRLITAAFLHYGPFHRIGSGRFLALYIVSGLAGSAGALLWSPLVPTVGASGAIFGILGAGLVLERQRDYVFGGSALGIIIVNFIFTFSISSISKGGHIGGLIGGILCALGLTRFGRGSAAYGRAGVLGWAVIVGVGVASIAIAYWKTRAYV